MTSRASQFPAASLPVEPPCDPARGGVLTVDLGAIRRNYRLLRARVAPSVCGAVVKADGYGLGAVEVVRALLAEGCRHFYVAHLAEALALRDIVPAESELIVLHGAAPGAEEIFANTGILPVLNSQAQIGAYAALARRLRHVLPAYLQLDTGMARFGLSAADLEAVTTTPGALVGIGLRGVMSHLACADTPEHPANAAQIAAFRRMLQALPKLAASLAASSGIFLGKEAHFDLVRPGAALYGVAPVPGQAHGLENVVRLDAMVLQLRDVPAGTQVGYGHTHAVTRPSRLATVAVGYADGFYRALSGKGAAYFGEVALPIIGRVSMDSLVLDATGTDLAPGALVELIGPHRGVDDLARDAGTIGYEILTSLGGRFERRYVDA
jgi:alanine racemase